MLRVVACSPLLCVLHVGRMLARCVLCLLVGCYVFFDVLVLVGRCLLLVVFVVKTVMFVCLSFDVRCLPCVACFVLLAVCGLLMVVCCLLFGGVCLWFVVCCLLFAA